MRITFIALLALAACTAGPAPSPPTTLTLSGDLTRADHQTYREIPFTVPAGATRIAIDLAYTGKENKSVIDLGLRDPTGQRGWSGGNKSHIEIGEFDATPSYRPGRLQPGEWLLVLGVPNIREGQTAHYDATITLNGPAPATATRRPPTPAPVTAPILSSEPGWRRGDFHAHTAHSDGSCASANSTERAPCPAINTFEAARDAGLDFIAVTDHNTITQLADIREQQAAFPKTLLIPGMEITTFHGHANAIGVTDFLDFQLGSRRLPGLAKLQDQIAAQGGILSINHPAQPSGEVCMGCGWTAPDTDFSRIAAIEIANGASLRTGGAEGVFSGISFWERKLKEGFRITAIGGSDNHDATDRTGARQSPIGKPTTVVWSGNLSTKAIVDGVRSGRVFVDLAGLPGATLDMEGAASGEPSVFMGGEIRMPPGAAASIAVNAANAPPLSVVKLVSHNLDVQTLTSGAATLSARATLVPGAMSGYLRPELRDAAGKLLLLGNPIFVRAR